VRQSIIFGSKNIEFELEFSNRKSLGITVTPEMDVMVKAPIGASIERVEEIVRKRAAWILKQQSFFLSFHPKMPARRIVSGETHLYLGRQYRVKIIHATEESVKLKGAFIEVYTLEKERAEALVKTWYLNHAKAKFHKVAVPLIERFQKYKVAPSSLVIREMAARWGSCTPKGKIILNPELIKAPKACIEYVIIHELCHLVHHDHTQKFIDLQTREMPNWEKWKHRLETLLA